MRHRFHGDRREEPCDWLAGSHLVRLRHQVVLSVGSEAVGVRRGLGVPVRRGLAVVRRPQTLTVVVAVAALVEGDMNMNSR